MADGGNVIKEVVGNLVPRYRLPGRAANELESRLGRNDCHISPRLDELSH
jgi:hypothetical protein